MASYALYSINFYDEALENLNRFIKKYPKNKNVIYAHYLITIIFLSRLQMKKRYGTINQNKK